MASHHFVTVDVETDVIQAGVRVISELRDRLEAQEGIRIPLVWFVRFQREWNDYFYGSAAEAFQRPMTDGFDGFALCRRELLELRDRGDEIGWHYHAYNYVHRDDLSHATRLEILRADLESCGKELRRRHPEFPVESFRFGWFFVPDDSIYDRFESLGITRDASIDPHRGGQPVADFSVRYPQPLVTEPARRGGLAFFPNADSNTLLTHDWEVISHDFGWSRLDEDGAAAERRALTSRIAAVAADLKRDGGEFLTYETASSSLVDGPDRA